MDINWVIDSPFARVRAGDPEAIALSVDGTAPLTYAQLRERRNRYANLLLEAGVKHGDRVGMIMHNCLDYVALYFATALIGAIAVRINFRLATPEFSYILSDAGCEFVFFHASRAEQLSSIREQVAVKRWFCMPEARLPTPPWAEQPAVDSAAFVAPQAPRPRAEDPVVILYTSGTTGYPKGSVWTHQNTLWAASMQAIGWRYGPETIALSVGPMHHVMGMEVMILAALLTHGTGVLMTTGALTVQRLVDAVQASRATHIFVPAFLLNDMAHRTDFDLGKLSTAKLLMCGGDTAQPAVIEAVQRRLPQVAIQQAYGLTEGGSIVTMLDPALAMTHSDSVGQPLPLCDISVRREDGAEAEIGELGEVWVRSPAVSGAYWNKPQQSRATFTDGWCKTGDLGRATADHQLVLSGRSKDMVRSGGENIYPAEVEAVLAGYPGVAGVAVVAVPDAKYMEVGCAVIQPVNQGQDRAGLEQALRQHARSHLAKYKCPKHYVFVEEFPLTGSGKILKRELRERFASLGTAPSHAPG